MYSNTQGGENRGEVESSVLQGFKDKDFYFMRWEKVGGEVYLNGCCSELEGLKDERDEI